jgi:hypothetical protein
MNQVDYGARNILRLYQCEPYRKMRYCASAAVFQAALGGFSPTVTWLRNGPAP